jgi:transposase
VDGLGNPLRITLTPGQCHEITQAKALIEGFGAEFVIGDTAFDADDFRACVAQQGSPAVIPSHPSRAKRIGYDKDLYKERHAVECFINKIKHYRRIATRYEKTARNFLAMVHLACAMIWLR